MATEEDLRRQLNRLSARLDARIPKFEELDRYYCGDHPAPPLIQRANLTKAYRTLMDMTASNWPKLIVDSVEERIEVQGVRFGNSQKDDQDAWDIWQANGLDAEASMLHQSAFTDGRAYVVVWGNGSTEAKPKITLEHACLCIVEYEPGTRNRRAALRRWQDQGRWYANLYRPDGIYKFQAKEIPNAAQVGAPDYVPPTAENWERREVENETWPLANPLDTVPVVEFAVNRSLRPNPFGTAQGEYEANLRHVDRINYKVFCGLVALTWSGFPLRALIGDPILRDDDGNPIPPFDALVDSIVQLENADAKLMQLPEASIDNYSPEMDIKHLAALTKTPAHYLLGEMVNLSADAIRAAEAALVAKARRHARALGESWEEVIRLGFRVMDAQDSRGQDQSAQIIWADPESRSLAERADAALKLKDLLPWQPVAEKVLGATPQEIQRWQDYRNADGLSALMTQANPAGNGVAAY